MEIEKQSWETLAAGYRREPDGAFVCNSCGQRFEPGEVYPLSGRLFLAERAAELHLRGHGDRLEALFEEGGKYNTFTENQQNLLRLFRRGRSDAEIAAELGVAPSTVRHQRFLFRERAKQAKFCLAAYHLALDVDARGAEEIVPVHTGAKMVDEPYVVAEREREKILRAAFESFEPLKLKVFSAKEKKKLVILAEIAEQFQFGRRYSEREVNELLRAVYEDYALLRRYLVEYGFLERTRDCAEYWRR